MSRLVYYSLALPRTHPRPDLLWQLDTSLSTLRTYNECIPIVLFVWGGSIPELDELAARYGVTIHVQPGYQERLTQTIPQAAEALSHYPLLHKFLNFGRITELDPEQVLYLDCDTVLRGDVELLFDRYRDAHLFAREEVNCARSHYGYDPEFIDETALGEIGAPDGIQPAPPFNLGAVLFNGEWYKHLTGLESVLLDYAWRFTVGMASHPPAAAAAQYGEGDAITHARQQSLEPADKARALPFPSANSWILDEVVLWLTLGYLPGLQTGDFSPTDVIQNGEFLHPGTNPNWILCHYYTQNRERMHAWLESPAYSA